MMKGNWLQRFCALFNHVMFAAEGANQIYGNGNTIINNSDDASLFSLNQYFNGDKKLIPYFNLSREALEDGTVWHDRKAEPRVSGLLDSKGVCVVKASVGRGKSYLSLSLAYSYYKEGYEVFFTHKTWDWDKVSSVIYDRIQTENNLLFVLENVHLKSDKFSDIISQIKAVLKVERSFNVLFLLNMRPSAESGSTSLLNGKWISERTFDLDPDQESRSKRFMRHLAGRYNLELNDLKVGNRPLLHTSQPNLEVITALFEVYTDRKTPSTSITEGDVLALCADKYGLSLRSAKEMSILMLLGALGTYEVPLDSLIMEEDECKLLIECRTKGLCYEIKKKFYLSHSTDAWYLCAAVSEDTARQDAPLTERCRKSIAQSVIDYYRRIVAYSETMVSFSSERKEVFKYEIRNDFFAPILFNLGNEEPELLAYFTNPEVCFEIVSKLCPSYIVKAMCLFTDEDKEARFNSIYLKSIPTLRENLLELSPGALRALHWALKNRYDYGEGMVKDLFEDIAAWEVYLKKYYSLLFSYSYQFKSAVCELSSEHKTLTRKIKDSIPDFHAAQAEVYAAYKKMVSGGMDKVTAFSVAQEAVEKEKKKLQVFPGVGSSRDISLLLHNLYLIDPALFEQTLNDEAFIKETNLRLEKTELDIADLYLFSNYYSRNAGIKAALDRIIYAERMDYTVKARLLDWFYLIQRNQPDVTYEEGTLAFAVEEALKNN